MTQREAEHYFATCAILCRRRLSHQRSAPAAIDFALFCVCEKTCVRHSLTHRQSQALLVKGRRRVDGRILRRRRKQSRLFSRCYLLQICAHIVYPGVVRSPEFFTTLLWGVNLGHAQISSHPASCFNFPHRPWGIKTIFSLTKIFTIYFKKSLIWRVNSSGETHV